MQLKFIGAIEGVTGSKHLLITEKRRQILLDCGLYQGMGKETDPMNRHLGLNPAQIEAVILSHAHIDHCGNLPTLVREGFKGKIYCTPATRDVCEILLLDSAHIHESDIKYINKKRLQKGHDLLKPLYTVKHVELCMRHFKTIPYESEFHLNDEISFHFTDVGHIIGAASVHITARESGKTTKLSFTGDVGRYTDLILKRPSPFTQADHIICESTYGNKLHDGQEDASARLLSIVKDTCLVKKGKVIIPSFSLGRTQELLYVIDQLKNQKLLPVNLRVYVDSPLSSKATEVVKKHPECFNEKLKEYIHSDPEPFNFPGLTFIEEVEDSKALNESDEPCIIISASGMADAGRVKHHIKKNVVDAKNTILIVGYCSPRSLAADLEAGKPQVHIFGEIFDVKARVESLHSFSAHADYLELIRFLSCQDKEKVKTLFLVHGETEAKSAFRERLLKEGYKNVIIGEKGMTQDLQ